MTRQPADLTPLETWLNTHPGTAHISTTTAQDLRRLVAAMLADAHETGKREGAAEPAQRMCSQCGERMAAMVKVGTSDGWCTVCLEEAADSEVAARVEAVLRHWGSSEDMAAILIRTAVRAALDPNGGGS